MSKDFFELRKKTMYICNRYHEDINIHTRVDHIHSGFGLVAGAVLRKRGIVPVTRNAPAWIPSRPPSDTLVIRIPCSAQNAAFYKFKKNQTVLTPSTIIQGLSSRIQGFWSSWFWIRTKKNHFRVHPTLILFCRMSIYNFLPHNKGMRIQICFFFHRIRILPETMKKK